MYHRAVARPVNPRPSASDRTRRLLLQTARELVAAGEVVSVQAVAERAGVSRATAYRYFTNADSVLLQTSLPLRDDPLDDPDWSYARFDPDADPATRIEATVRAMGEWAFDHEHELRALLAASLQPDSNERGLSRSGKLSRHRWIDAILKDLPPQVDARTRKRLATALVPLFGADAVVWTTDAAGLTRKQAIDQLAWTARALVEAVLRDVGTG